MKISLGLVACAFLASDLAASADTTAKRRYKQNGDLCTADEIANPPVVKIRYKGGSFNHKVECRTKGEWNVLRSAGAEQDRANARGHAASQDTEGYTYRAPSPPGNPPTFRN